MEEVSDFPLLEAPAFEDTTLEARWYELMNLYTSDQPDKIFEVLGREDCERNSIKTNITNDWNHGGISTFHSDPDPHVYDCHHFFAKNGTVNNDTTTDP